MPSKIRVIEPLSFVPFVIALGACTSTTTVNVPADAPVAQTAADVTVATNYEASLAWAAADAVPVGLFVLDATTGTTPAVAPGSPAASAAAAAVDQYFSPSGCVSASANGNVATFNLNNCTGPDDLTSVSGSFTATFTPTPQGLQIQLTGSNISANSANISFATQGLLTLGSDMVTKTFQANSTSGGTGPYGYGVARTGSYTLTWQSATNCGTINSSFMDGILDGGLASVPDSGLGGSLAGVLDSGLDGGFISTTTMANYVRCQHQCPLSGTTTRSFANGTVTITYNGTSNPPWTASNGETGTINLHCP